MPYHVGEKGSYGCSGYPAVKDDGEVMGCHPTREAAEAQIFAINQSEGNVDQKDTVTTDSGVGIKNPQGWPGTAIEHRKPKLISKNEISEGDFVIVGKKDKALVGQIIHIMRDGVLGIPGEEKTIEATADNPAAMIRIFEQDDDSGFWEPTDYFYGDRLAMFVLIDPLMMEPRMDEMSKAESYTPNDGMKAAARRALKWKEEGKATGAGTPVGWGRASDIVAGRSMSLSVVRRMYSFFSRHEVDKKGKDFYNTSNPSNGRIMWDAWGGDAGFAWSRAIVRRNEDKALFADFGKDFTRSTSLPDLFKSVGVGSMVSWNSSGGRAEGKITRIIRNGRYNVPGTDVTVTGTPEDPAAVIRLYRDGKPTDTIVAHKLKTLRGK